MPATPPLRSLLVSIDLTPVSDRALGRLALLPLADDARVTLLHVVPAGAPARERQIAERDAARALADEARQLRRALPRKVRIETLVQRGAPAKQIGACATRVRADLIVMGRGQGRALRDAFLGSTAERVLRQALRPVLVVRRPARAAYQRPALALDFDQAAQDVVRLVLRVLPPPRPRVHVIHAYDAPFGGLVYRSLAQDEIEDAKDARAHEATQKLAKLFAAALRGAGVPLEQAPASRLQVRYGSPRLVVEKAVRQNKTDLLALGTRGYAGAAHLFLGTVAGELLREARCDVLVVPPGASPGRARSLRSRAD